MGQPFCFPGNGASWAASLESRAFANHEERAMFNTLMPAIKAN